MELAGCLERRPVSILLLSVVRKAWKAGRDSRELTLILFRASQSPSIRRSPSSFQRCSCSSFARQMDRAPSSLVSSTDLNRVHLALEPPLPLTSPTLDTSLSLRLSRSATSPRPHQLQLDDDEGSARRWDKARSKESTYKAFDFREVLRIRGSRLENLLIQLRIDFDILYGRLRELSRSLLRLMRSEDRRTKKRRRHRSCWKELADHRLVAWGACEDQSASRSSCW